MIRNKINQILACALIVATTMGVSTSIVFASETKEGLVQAQNKLDITLNDGSYEVKNKTSYIEPSNATGESMARNSLKENTKIFIKDGRATMTLFFNENLFEFMKGIKASVGNEDLKGVVDKDSKCITFDISSVEKEVKVDMFITMMGKNVTFFVNNDLNTIKLLNEAPIFQGNDVSLKVGDNVDLESYVSANDKEDGKVNIKLASDVSNFIEAGIITKSGTFKVKYTAKDSAGFESTKEINVISKESTILEQGKYSIKNDVKYIGEGNAEIGNQMARKVLLEESEVTVKDGKTILTINFDKTQIGFIGDVAVKVNDKATTINLNRDTAKADIEIPSINADVIISTYVIPMGKTTSFSAVLKGNTLEKVKETVVIPGVAEETKTNSKPNTNTETNISNTGEDTKSNIKTDTNINTDTSISTNAGVSTIEKATSSIVGVEKPTIVQGKLYSVENEVNYANETGRAMARQYLEKISSFEEVNGKKYISLTFTGMNYMKNHRFYANGKEVPAEIIAQENNKATYKFEIPSIDCNIKVKIYVEPMGREVEFEVKLLKNTLKFVKEYKVEKLPETGGIIDNNILISMGSLLVGAGGVLRRKRR